MSISISIVIPTLNEEREIGRCLDSLPRSPDVEIVVADGGSDDRTVEEAKARGAFVLRLAPGRGPQQHVGAESASGNALLFLHCDTRLPQNFAEQIQQTLRLPGVVAGAFQLAIAAPGLGFRLVETGANLRSSLLSLPYGDQGVFMTRAVYFAVGGFPRQAIMEDLELMVRLKQLGRIAIAPSCVVTSARRWQRYGIIRTTIVNQLLLLGRAGGISPHALLRWQRNLTGWPASFHASQHGDGAFWHR